MKRRLKAFTLIEVISVLIIVSILVVVAVPNYQKAIEQARDKEAIAILRLIQAGERIYHSKIESYYPVTEGVLETTAGNINDSLHLQLNEREWDYSVENRVGGVFVYKAEKAGIRTWVISNNDCNSVFSAYCTPAANCPPGSGKTLVCPDP